MSTVRLQCGCSSLRIWIGEEGFDYSVKSDSWETFFIVSWVEMRRDLSLCRSTLRSQCWFNSGSLISEYGRWWLRTKKYSFLRRDISELPAKSILCNRRANLLISPIMLFRKIPRNMVLSRMAILSRFEICLERWSKPFQRGIQTWNQSNRGKL